MQRFDLVPLINTLLCFLLAIIWTFGLIIPGLILIDSITNNVIYSFLYIITMSVIGVVIISVIMSVVLFRTNYK